MPKAHHFSELDHEQLHPPGRAADQEIPTEEKDFSLELQSPFLCANESQPGILRGSPWGMKTLALGFVSLLLCVWISWFVG